MARRRRNDHTFALALTGVAAVFFALALLVLLKGILS